jgi:hypothetical protein
MRHRWLNYGVPLLIIILASSIYLSFPSRQYDQNGLIEAIGVEDGLDGIFSPNHLLYRPLGLLVYRLAGLFGYAGPSVVILQLITAICAALTVGIAYSAFITLVKRPLIALCATLLLATSWSFWTFATDAYYITPAAMFAAGAFAVTVRPHFTILRAIGIGILIAFAVLMWQANIFLLPALIVLMLHLNPHHNLYWRTLFILIVGMTSSIVTAVIYLIVGVLVLGNTNPETLISWFMNYNGARLPLWGRLELERIFPAGLSAVASIIPLWDGLGLRDLMQGKFTLEQLPGQFALLGLFILTLITLWRLAGDKRPISSDITTIVCLFFGYIVYTPFIIWWDPYEPKWFVIPNLFLIGVFAVVWSRSPKDSLLMIPIIVCVLLIAFGNFTLTILPRHTLPNAAIQQADCIARNTNSLDLIITTDWRWNTYLAYFHDRTVFDVVHESGTVDDSAELVGRLKQHIAAIHYAGGKAYIPDLSQYSQMESSWFKEQTNLSIQDFQDIMGSPAFHCEYVTFLQVSIPNDTGSR